MVLDAGGIVMEIERERKGNEEKNCGGGHELQLSSSLFVAQDAYKHTHIHTHTHTQRERERDTNSAPVQQDDE